MKANWKELSHLTDMVRDVEMAKLARINAERGKLNFEIDCLKQQKNTRAETVHVLVEMDVAQISGNDERWRDWAEDEIRRKVSNSALVASEFERQTVKTRHAFGRAQAVASIAKKGDVT